MDCYLVTDHEELGELLGDNVWRVASRETDELGFPGRIVFEEDWPSKEQAVHCAQVRMGQRLWVDVYRIEAISVRGRRDH